MNDDIDLNALIDLLQRSEPPAGASTHDLALVVTAVDTGSRVTGYLSPDFAQHISSGRDLRVPIARRRIIRGAESSDGGDYVPGFSTFREYVLWALNLTQQATTENSSTPTSGGIRHLMFGHGSDEYAVPAICSALPFARTLETFTLDSTHHWQNRLAATDVAWLGYALFHPATSSSTWKRLWIRNVGNQYADPDAFALMADGNNLARALGLTDHISNAYFSAMIRSGAVLRSKPASDDGGVVEILSVTTEMDVCVESTDPSLLPEYVLVVVVGHGAAWVHRDSVERIVARPPGCPELTGLSIEGSHLPSRIFATLVQRVSTRGLEFISAGDSVLGASDIHHLRIPSIYISKRL
ncbi:hypothetical protein PINS_up011544 [Pythium insidiosum]|nr:hypothetical protein PINS_up011544 [Pythium insidiosum]